MMFPERMNLDVSIADETGRFVTCSAPSPRSCGERVGVRGCIRKYRDSDVRGASPSPAALRTMLRIAGYAATSPRKRGEVRKKSHRALQHFGEVGLFPGEAALIVRRAAEIAVGRGPRINRPVEIEMLADAARRQVHRLGHDLLALVLAHLPGVMGIDIDRQRPRHADRVSELQRAAI